jgi:hypothetical protein
MPVASMTYYFQLLDDMGIGAFARLVAVAPLVGAVPATVAAVIFRRSFPPAPILVLLGECVIVGVIYFGFVCSIGLESSVPARYIDYLRRLSAAWPAGDVRTADV